MIIGGATPFYQQSLTSYTALDVNMQPLTSTPMPQPIGGFSTGGGGTFAPTPTGLNLTATGQPTVTFDPSSFYSPLYSPHLNTSYADVPTNPYVAAPNYVAYAHYAPGTAQAAQGQATTATTTTPTTGATTKPSTAKTTAADAAKAKTEKEAAAKSKATAKAKAADKAKAAEKAKPAPPEPKTVTVAPGDSLSKIAAANGTTWQKLYEANKGAIGGDPNLIHAGLKLKLP